MKIWPRHQTPHRSFTIQQVVFAVALALLVSFLGCFLHYSISSDHVPSGNLITLQDQSVIVPLMATQDPDHGEDLVEMKLILVNPHPVDRLIVVALDSTWIQDARIQVASQPTDVVTEPASEHRDSVIAYPSRALLVAGEQSLQVLVSAKQSTALGANVVVAPYNKFVEHQSKLIAIFGMLIGTAVFTLVFVCVVAVITRIPYLFWYCGYLFTSIITLSILTGSYSVYIPGTIPLTLSLSISCVLFFLQVGFTRALLKEGYLPRWVRFGLWHSFLLCGGLLVLTWQTPPEPLVNTIGAVTSGINMFLMVACLVAHRHGNRSALLLGLTWFYQALILSAGVMWWIGFLRNNEVVVLTVLCFWLMEGVTIGHCVYQRLRQEERLLTDSQSQEEQADLAAVTSYEGLIRTIKQTFSGMEPLVQLMTEVESMPPKMNLRMQGIASAMQNLNDIMSNFIYNTRLRQGSLEVVPVSFELLDLLETIKSSMNPLMERKNLYFDVQTDHSLLCHIRCDRSFLLRIIFNLLHNAVKFTDTGGIRLDCAVIPGRLSRATLQIRVTDSGAGMSEEDLKKIWSQHYQTGQKRSSGSGLGLYICKELVELMQGTIEPSSVLGVGTTVTLQIPIVVVTEEGQQVLSEGIRLPHWSQLDLGGRQCLVAYTDTLLQEATSYWLSALNGRLIHWPQGPEGAATLEFGGSIDLIVVGVQAGDQFLNLVNQIRHHNSRDARQPTIIVDTSFLEPGLDAEALLPGADLYVAEPMKSEAVYQLLRDRLSPLSEPALAL